MNRYPDFVRYFVVYLVAVYTLADGHLLCAPCLVSAAIPCVQHDCSPSHRQTCGVFASTSCCSDNHNDGKFPCSGNDLPAIVVQCCTNELVKLLEFHIAGYILIVPVKHRSELLDFGDITTFHSSAISLRLHLSYGVLLI